MKWNLWSIATSLGLFASSIALAADPLAGYDRLDVKTAHRASPVAASVWYPVGRPTYRGLIGDNAVFKGTQAFVGATIAEGEHPLILFSHGSGGNMDAMSWILSDLALRGAIVLAVNHPGSTTGDSSPRRSVELEDRAADLSAALDQVLANPAFAPFIDRSRISALGFSLGGGTALGLAGLRYDASAYAHYCAEWQESAPDCVFFTKGGVDFGALPSGFSTSARDERVGSAIAVDPAFTYAVDAQSLNETELPVLLINLGDEALWPAVDVSDKGSNLAQRLVDGHHAVIAPGHHFTFLAECKTDGADLLAAAEDDPVCDDPEGTKRQDAHMKIVDAIADFLGL